MAEQLYRYCWGNDKTPEGKFRLRFKGRICCVLFRSKMNTAQVKFIDNNEQTICSRNALRKVEKEDADK